MTLLLLFTLFALPILAFGDSHPFNERDLVTLKRIGDPQISPDNTRIIFTLRETDLENNRGFSNLWLTGSDGAGLKQITNNPASDYNPRWSRGGEFIYFLSARSGSSQVWKIRPEGGEATQVTDFPLSIGGMEISPNGRTLLVSMDVFPGKTPQETSEQLAADEEDGRSGKLYENLFVRHWDFWADGRRSHLFAVAVRNTEE